MGRGEQKTEKAEGRRENGKVNEKREMTVWGVIDCGMDKMKNE